MATNVPAVVEAPSRGRLRATQLYRGADKGRPLGEVLKRMANDGRGVILGQRARLQENRLMYRGEQWLQVNPSAQRVRAIARETYLRSGRRRDVFNRLRQMVDGRTAMLTARRPPFEVVPPSQDQDLISAARQATRFVEVKWRDWELDRVLRDLALAGDQDGCVFLNVIYDKQRGDKTMLTTGPDGQPLYDPGEVEAARMIDPMNESGMFGQREVRLGEVSFRVVRMGHLSIDPFMTSEWADAKWIVESRVRPRVDIEAEIGRRIDDLIPTSIHDGSVTISDINVEDSDGTSHTMSKRDAVLVHEAYVLPQREWPKGAHVRWLDLAPDEPLSAEPYDETELPYFPYVPRPDGGNLLRSRGVVDDLKPIQVSFNRVLSLLHEWLDRVARPPTMIPYGSIRGDDIYSPRGYVEYHAGLGEPHYMPTPAEPAAVLNNYLGWLENQMAEIATQSDPTRGMAPGQGVESAIALQNLIQQNEQQMSGTEQRFVAALEWGVTRALKLVGKHYIVPRIVNTPGVDDAEEFQAFVGEQLRGCSQLRVTGTILPQSRAAQLQTLMNMAPVLGEGVRPWIGKMIEGDVSEFVRHEDLHQQRQRRENRMLAAVVRQPQVTAIFAEFEQDVAMFAQAMQAAAAQAYETGEDPRQSLEMQGIRPPSFTDYLSQAGVEVPFVEDYDNHAQHMLALDTWRIADGFERMPKPVKQLAREHAQRHQEALASQLGAMGAQVPQPGASSPNPRGTPSPPKKPGGTGGGGATPPQVPSGGVA